MNRAALKEAAKKQIKGKIGILFLITLIIAAVSFISTIFLSMIPLVGSIASFFVTAAFALSTIRIYLNLMVNQEPEPADAFSGFDDIVQAFLLNLLIGIFTFLWSLLFFIPGIVKAYSYSMSMYILAENKGKSALECINESKAMTQGHKMDLFILDLSFLGWEFLSAFTLFILNIWLVPYINATRANVYDSLKPVTTTRVPEDTASVEELPEAESQPTPDASAEQTE